MKVVKSTKEIMGVEPSIGSEWDAGYLPAACCHRSVRVTVRKDADELWTVFALGRKGEKVLAKNDIAVFRCETCAKAFSLCLVHGADYAECEVHSRDEFTDADIFDATVKVLLAVMGIDISAWEVLDTGSKNRVAWIVRQLIDGKADWTKAIAAWEFVSEKHKGMSLRTKVSVWFSELTWS